MINNGLEGSLEKVAKGIDSIDKRNIGAGIKECVAENDRIIQAEMARKLEEQKRIKEDNRRNLDSLVDRIRDDMGDGR